MGNIESIGGLFFANFDDEAIVFNSHSGELHLIYAVSLDLLLLCKHGAGKFELIDKLEKTYNYSPQQAEDFVSDCLSSFKQLNLIGLEN